MIYTECNKPVIKYIINNNTINQNSFINIIKILHYDEGGNLQKTYMSNHYQNYEKLKKIMNATHETFIKVLNDFLSKLRLFNNNIRSNKLNKNSWISSEQDFILKLIKLTKLQFNNNSVDLLEFIDDYIRYYQKNGKLPEVRVTLVKYSKTLNSAHHKINLEKYLDKIDPNLKITKYDEEIYKLDNMLDEYVKKLNATSINLGYVSVNPKTYTWTTEKIEDSVKKYYYNFFSINDIKSNDMNKLLNEYIDGLMWVFKYYYNIDTENANKPDIWFYNHTHAPLLTQLYNFIKTQEPTYLTKLINNLSHYKVDPEKYFKPSEHLMYVSPINYYKSIIPKKYTDKITNEINVGSIIDNIWNDNTSNEIDCRGVLFLNKCHISQLHIHENINNSWNHDKSFINKLRN